MTDLRGVAARETLRVPGSASAAGVAPSIVSGSLDSLGGWFNFFPLLLNALAMAEWSVGRLANWWNTFRLRMIVYTRLELPVMQNKIIYTYLWLCLFI